MLRPRLIVLGHDGKPSKKVGMDPLVHLAEVLKQPSDEQGVLLVGKGDAAPIKTLIRLARAREWRRHLAALLPDQSAGNLREMLEESDPLELISDLPADRLKERAQERFRELGLPEALAQHVIDAAKRPTVFGVDLSSACLLVPDANKPQTSDLRELFEAMGQELSLDSGLMNDRGLAFVPIGAMSQRTDAFQALLARLQSRLTSVPHIDPVRKEGPVLLIGKTGSGKTELASALHQAMRQHTGRDGQLVVVNVAAIQPGLLESRLRGHIRGAFTDAKKEQPGWFELADNGTLFLDEFQCAPIEVQLQLLDLIRAVSDTVQVARIGEEGNKRRFRVKLILATNESLERLRAEERLREDLLFRIRHLIEVPPLQCRLESEDRLLHRLWCLNRWRSNPPIDLFAAGPPQVGNMGLDRMSEIYGVLPPELPTEAHRLLRAHPWPGNLREFERVCFDAFWEYDQSGSGAARDWVDVIQRALRQGSIAVSPSAPPLANATTLERLRQAEQVLLRHDFKVSPAGPELAGLKLKSPKALKAFLRHNRAHLLLPDWKRDGRAKRLLGD